MPINVIDKGYSSYIKSKQDVFFTDPEVEHIVEVGEIDPDEVMTPGILIDKIIVQGGNQ